jgi:hypothetical protein
MKAATEKQAKVRDDFYSSTLAPVSQRRDLRFRALDVFILTVLFLEAAVLIRLFLAK